MAEVRGLQELLANLEDLNVSMRSACRGAVNAAAQDVKRAAIANARAQGLVNSGALVNNIAVKRERGTPETITEYHIGVRHGKESKGTQRIALRGSDGKIRYEYTDNPFYWHMWEFGHYNVFLRRHVSARAFMRPAMLAREDGLLEIMRSYLAARLERTQNRILAV